MKKLIALVAALAMSLSLTACGATLTKIEAPPEIVLEKGETKLVELVNTFSKENLDAEAIQKALDAANLTWTSSDEAIVTVTDGTVNALAAGEADITVTAKDISATIHVTVVVTPTDVEAPDTLQLVINGENIKNLDAKITPEGALGVKLQYESSDEKVAAVDETGQVTAVGTGECVITTTLAPQEPAVVADEKIATIKTETKVTVSVAATGIAMDSTSSWIYVGGSVELKPYTVPAEAAASTYTFKSDNENVATVSESGTITGKAAGAAKITVTSADGFTAAYDITVKAKTTTTKPTSGGSTGTAGGGSTGGGNTGGGSTGGGTTPTPQPPAPAPTPQPPAPTPDPPVPEPPQHYHGNGSDTGACPVCGCGYSRATRS